MQAIQTKYQGPTNARGSRVTARCESGRISLAWDDGLDAEDNHRAAANALLQKLDWSGDWLGGGLIGDGYVFVHAQTPIRIEREGEPC